MQAQTNTGVINKNLLILHFTVFIWGFTSILGALISISSVQLVWYRVLIAALSLFVYFKFNSTGLRVNKKMFSSLFFTGGLVGAHWILFFQAIKSSTVPVTLVCLSSLALFTAIFEPLFSKKRIAKLEILAGSLIIVGIVIIFKFETRYTTGIICGLLSAMCASLFAIINSKQVKIIQPQVIAFYELLGALCWISLFMLFTHGFNSSMMLKKNDIIYLLILGTICTSLAYVAGVSVMREISAFKVALITNLEPVYGILMSFVFFGDSNKMQTGFWVGAMIILSTIFLFPVAQKRLDKRKSQ